MVFGGRTHLRLCEDIPILINGYAIERVHEFKYLGIYIDEALTFDKHAQYIYNNYCIIVCAGPCSSPIVKRILLTCTMNLDYYILMNVVVCMFAYKSTKLCIVRIMLP